LSAEKKIRRALLSVTDKNGLVEFAQALASFGVELVSTGGTAAALRTAGLAVKDISELTGFPEMLDGRVKTLHPKVHGGLLYIRGNADHEAAVAAHGIEPIGMVVVNLYAFEKTAAQPGVAFGHLIENIDIGGPSMVRSAAKNFEDVAIVTLAADYPALTEELKANGGALSRETRWKPAKQALPPPPPTTPPSPTLWTASPKCLCLPALPLPMKSNSRKPCASTSRWPSRCVTARIPTSAPPSMRTAPVWS